MYVWVNDGLFGGVKNGFARLKMDNREKFVKKNFSTLETIK